MIAHAYKSAVAAVGGVCTWLATAGADGRITVPELCALPLAAATAAGVYQVRNRPSGQVIDLTPWLPPNTNPTGKDAA